MAHALANPLFWLRPRFYAEWEWEAEDRAADNDQRRGRLLDSGWVCDAVLSALHKCDEGRSFTAVAPWFRFLEVQSRVVSCWGAKLIMVAVAVH